MTVYTIWERTGELHHDLLREPFHASSDQRDSPQNLIRRRFGPKGSQLVGDREGPRVLAEDEGPLSSDSLWLNRFVGRGMLDHAVRVDPRLVGEGIVADEWFRDPDRDPAQTFDELGEVIKAGDFDSCVVPVQGLE